MGRREWREYNEALVMRGELWIRRELLSKIKEEVREVSKRRGRPYKFRTFLIIFFLILKYKFKLGYRQLEGFIRAMFGGLGILIPNFRTIWYRNKKMEIEYDMGEEISEDAIVVLDSTGIKITNRGEWMRSRERVSNRKGWVKVHIAYDLKAGKVVGFEVTDERGQDSKEGLKMLKELYEKTKRSNKRIRKVIADAGYDTHEIFNYLSERCISAVIKLRRNAKLSENLSRSRIIRYMRDSGNNWSRELGYNKRWLIESFFSSYKRFFGEYVSSRRMDSIKKEIFFKLLIMNSFYSYNNLTN
jgi:transposase